ncbi:MAG: hypothetical protein WC346_08115 [Methanogenium sp.]
MSRKAYKKTRRNQLALRLKKCEFAFRKIKKSAKEIQKINKNHSISDKSRERQILQIDEETQPYVQFVRRNGIAI